MVRRSETAGVPAFCFLVLFSLLVEGEYCNGYARTPFCDFTRNWNGGGNVGNGIIFRGFLGLCEF
jgi:hypothetical protein